MALLFWSHKRLFCLWFCSKTGKQASCKDLFVNWLVWAIDKQFAQSICNFFFSLQSKLSPNFDSPSDLSAWASAMTRIFTPENFLIVIAWALHGFSSKKFFRDKFLPFRIAFYVNLQSLRIRKALPDMDFVVCMITSISSSGFNSYWIINHGATDHLLPS